MSDVAMCGIVREIESKIDRGRVRDREIESALESSMFEIDSECYSDEIRSVGM